MKFSGQIAASSVWDEAVSGLCKIFCETERKAALT